MCPQGRAASASEAEVPSSAQLGSEGSSGCFPSEVPGAQAQLDNPPHVPTQPRSLTRGPQRDGHLINATSRARDVGVGGWPLCLTYGNRQGHPPEQTDRGLLENLY